VWRCSDCGGLRTRLRAARLCAQLCFIVYPVNALMNKPAVAPLRCPEVLLCSGLFALGPVTLARVDDPLPQGSIPLVEKFYTR
jgi:hypothetical protein